MVRSVVLFTHVIGMLVLFISIAFEWLTLESLRRATTSEQASSLVRLREMLPRVYGIAFVTLFVSGIYLARRLGLFEFAWVRLALGLLILMGILRRASCPITGACRARRCRARRGTPMAARVAVHASRHGSGCRLSDDRQAAAERIADRDWRGRGGRFDYRSVEHSCEPPAIE